METLTSWSTNAINLPEHATNPIHTDAGARAAGFDGAIVAGTTIYAYLTHVPAAAWGESWLRGGGGELRLELPVLDRQRVECRVIDGDDPETPIVEARVDGEMKASFEVWRSVEAPPMRSGEELPPLTAELTDELAGYGVRSGDDLALYRELQTAHPALWPNLANRVFTEHLISGPWIHTRSKIFHQGLPSIGETLAVSSTVVDRFETRSGERALVDIAITADGRPMVRIEHEALVSLTR